MLVMNTIVKLRARMFPVLGLSIAFVFAIFLLGQYQIVNPVVHQDMNGGMSITQCQSACSSQSFVNHIKNERQVEIKYPKPNPEAYYLLVATGFVYLGKVIVNAYQLRRLNWQPPDILISLSVSRT
jgi:hypothetical protein